MKKLFLFLFSTIVFGMTTHAQVKNINVAEFEKAIIELDDNEMLLDVRSKKEVKSGYIKGMINIDYYSTDFEKQIDLLDKTKTYYVYCAAGGRSMMAAKMMSEKGINNVSNLNGGIVTWKSKNKPVIKK